MATIHILPGSRSLPGQMTIHEKAIYRGGEGNIYFSTDDKYAVKMYHTSPADKQSMLEKILEFGKNLGEDEQFLAWPSGIVDRLDNQPVTGVVTRRVPSSHVPLYKLMYSPVDVDVQFRQGRSWLEYLKMARGAAAAVRTVHGKGMAHGDIHSKNFLANPASGEVVLIDLDGLIVKGFLAPQVKGMPGFIAPEVMMGKSRPEELTDRYSLAILLLWTLLMRNVMLTQKCYDPDDQMHDDELGYGQFACFSENPNDRRNWISRIGFPLFRNGLLSYHALTPKLQELTERTLIHGVHEPSKRPQALEWERALAEAYDVLIPCPVCRQSFFYPFWLQPPPRRVCPFCGTGVRAPFPLVLDLLEERARGAYVMVRSVVLYQGLPVFADITEPARLPPLSRRASNVPVIGQVAWDAKADGYRLLNMSDTQWTVISSGGGPVKRGASLALRRGMLFSFGAGKRLARVAE
jgi:DNA-binding helix-hairpin-helix protein with protein kinase domain